MRKSTLLRSQTRWATILLLFALSMPVGLAQTKPGSVRGEIAALLGKHDDAMNRHDMEAVLALFAPAPAKPVMLGTGPGERYQGAAEIKVAYTEFFKDFDKGSLNHNCYWKEGGSSGNLAWGAAMCKLSDSHDGKKREYELNVSAVAEKQKGNWYFVMLHYSNLTGNQ